jgi:hypothetical protein
MNSIVPGPGPETLPFILVHTTAPAIASGRARLRLTLTGGLC